jgi:hypothetical protein
LKRLKEAVVRQRSAGSYRLKQRTCPTSIAGLEKMLSEVEGRLDVVLVPDRGQPLHRLERRLHQLGLAEKGGGDEHSNPSVREVGLQVDGEEVEVERIAEVV